ncbi:MAG: hypothetical protein FWF81_12220 [Defluviitaleaceae bacterium]|nr:hypothetical protein [Defluviitaleaceae bacterium]
MESRKKRNLEIERKRKQKNRIVTGVFSLMVLIVVAIIGYSVWDILNRRTIMTFEGESISTRDFRFFTSTMDMPPGQAAQEAALESLLQTLVLLDRGAQHGLTPSEEEFVALEEDARNMHEQMAMSIPGGLDFIPDRRVAEFFSAWGEILNGLMDIYVDIEFDEEEFAEFLEENMEFFIQAATDMNVKYAASFDFTELEAAYERLQAGEISFDQLVEDYSFFHHEGEDNDPINIMEFIERYDAWEHGMDIVEMDEGDVMGVFEINGIFFVLNMYEHFIDDEILEMQISDARESREDSGRAEAFFEFLDQWINDADYTVNLRAIRHF